MRVQWLTQKKTTMSKISLTAKGNFLAFFLFPSLIRTLRCRRILGMEGQVTHKQPILRNATKIYSEERFGCEM